MITKQDVLNLTKEEEPSPIFSKHATQMNYNPFENVPCGNRRCGNCGKIRPLIVFKKKGKTGYDVNCPDCKEFLGAYK